MIMVRKNLLILLSFVTLTGWANAAQAKTSDFTLRYGQPVMVSMAAGQDSVVWTALELFTRDYRAVFGGAVKQAKASKAQVVVKTDPKLSGRTQAFRLEVNKGGQLLVTGSDKRGTAYGLLELSRLIGVSPWEWWADVEPEPREEFTLPAGYTDEQAPSVEYRGIFINDEDVGFCPWASETYEPSGVKGAIGPKTHRRVFELLLRLRANTFWPAMHSCSVPFFLTPGNREVAAKYGIFIGTSHCEPMACNVNGEWKRRGEGDYNYITNKENVLRFFRQRVDELRETGTEAIYTLGMRGYHDGAMLGVSSTEEYKEAIAKVMADQRQMLGDTGVPQVFIPYKEVLDVYNAGVEVPDDVTLLWCDDNYGYLTHFPTETERKRSGGNGLYYHISYWGRPQANTWLGSMSPSVMWQQLHAAYRRGIQRMWILNVGDIKPSEYLTELFLDMAWDIDGVKADDINGHGHRFLGREFGYEAAGQLAPVMEEYARQTHILRPEFTDGRRIEERDRRWEHSSDLPWSEQQLRWRLWVMKRLSDRVERIESLVPAARRDAYFQLVKYPVQASAQMNLKWMNAQLARHGLADWQVTDQANDSLNILSRIYNNDKWRGMMPYNYKWMKFTLPAEHDTLSTPLLEEERCVILNAVDARSGRMAAIQGLGYDGGAAELEKGEPVVFDLPAAPQSDSITVEIRLLPTYPVVGSSLRVSVDGQVFDYHETGRTEEWKRNVLRNYATRSVRIPVRRQITVTAIDEGVVLDQIVIRRKR